MGAKGSYVDFTISRGKSTSGDLFLNFSLQGIDGEYILAYYDKKSNTTASIANDATTIRINDGQASTVVRLLLKPDSKGDSTVVAQFSVALQSADKNYYYIDRTNNLAHVTVFDNDPTVTVKTVDARELGIINGSFTITSSSVALVGGMAITFRIAGTSTATLVDDFTLVGADGKDLAADSQGVYSVLIAQGKRNTVVGVRPVLDHIDEPRESVAMELLDKTYIKGNLTPSVVNIVNRVNLVPTLKPAAALSQSFPVAGSQTFTYAQLKAVLASRDDIDGNTLKFRVTAIAEYVAMEIGGKILGINNVIEVGDIVTVKIAAGAAISVAAGLFKVKALDGDNKLSITESLLKGKIIAAT